MPLLSKRPHRGLAKTRYSFVVTVERGTLQLWTKP